MPQPFTTPTPPPTSLASNVAQVRPMQMLPISTKARMPQQNPQCQTALSQSRCNKYQSIPVNVNGVLKNIIIPNNTPSAAEQAVKTIIRTRPTNIVSDGQILMLEGQSGGTKQLMLGNPTAAPATSARGTFGNFTMVNSAGPLGTLKSLSGSPACPVGNNVVRLVHKNSSIGNNVSSTNALSAGTLLRVAGPDGKGHQLLLVTSSSEPTKPIARPVSLLNSQAKYILSGATTTKPEGQKESKNDDTSANKQPPVLLHPPTSSPAVIDVDSEDMGLKIQSVYTLSSDTNPQPSKPLTCTTPSSPLTSWPSGVIEIKPDEDEASSSTESSCSVETDASQNVVQQTITSVDHATGYMHSVTPQSEGQEKTSKTHILTDTQDGSVYILPSESKAFAKPTLTVLGPPGMARDQILDILCKQTHLPTSGTVVLPGAEMVNNPTKIAVTQTSIMKQKLKPTITRERSSTATSARALQSLVTAATGNFNAAPLPLGAESPIEVAISRHQVAKKSTGRKRRQLNSAVIVTKSRKKLKAFREPEKNDEDQLEEIDSKSQTKDLSVAPCKVLMLKMDNYLTQPVSTYAKNTMYNASKFERLMKKARTKLKNSSLWKFNSDSPQGVLPDNHVAMTVMANPLDESSSTIPVQVGPNKSKFLMVKTGAGTFLVPVTRGTTPDLAGISVKNVQESTSLLSSTSRNGDTRSRSPSPPPPILLREAPIAKLPLERKVVSEEKLTEIANSETSDDSSDIINMESSTASDNKDHEREADDSPPISGLEDTAINIDSPVTENPSTSFQPPPYGETRAERIQRLRAQLLQTKVECEGVKWKKEDTKQVLDTMGDI